MNNKFVIGKNVKLQIINKEQMETLMAFQKKL